MDWFERLTGFREREYSATQSLLAVADGCLRSRVNGQVFAIGELETPTLAELRKRARAVSGGMQGPLGAACISGADVADLHRDRANESSFSPAQHAESLATLILEATYEATLWAAVLNAAESSCDTLYLTRVGGGAFGNDDDWIDAAMRRALAAIRAFALDVRLVSLGAPPDAFVCLEREYGSCE